MSTAGNKRSEARRAAKAAAQAKAAVQSEKDAKLRKEDVLAKEAEANEGKQEQPPKPKPTRKETERHLQENAVAAADTDSLAHPPTAEEIADAYKVRPGEPVPLHVLNARAKVFNKQNRDEARILANAAGKSVYDTLQEIAPRSRHGKFKKLRDLADDRERKSAQ